MFTIHVWRLSSQEIRDKYTRSDLDGLAEEEKQAWLEVIEEQKEAEVKGAAEGMEVSSEGAATPHPTAPEGKSVQDEEGGGGGGGVLGEVHFACVFIVAAGGAIEKLASDQTKTLLHPTHLLPTILLLDANKRW